MFIKTPFIYQCKILWPFCDELGNPPEPEEDEEDIED